MHIPEGYLSPSTCLTMGGVMLPLMYRAARIIKRTKDAAHIPFLAMGAVFSFLVMMFNIPIPDGTTAHAAGAVLIALALGPWAALVSVSVSIFIQALLFGDGGALSLGANAFNMAFLMPFAGYYTYKLIAKKAANGSKRQLLAAFLAGYVGINAAALSTAVMFGLQPLLFSAPDGTPLYCPYGLSIAVPAMLIPHLLIVGPLEGIVTALALKYLPVFSSDLVHASAAPTASIKEEYHA